MSGVRAGINIGVIAASYCSGGREGGWHALAGGAKQNSRCMGAAS